jgi:hypothetical protein
VVLLDNEGEALRRWAFQTTAIFKIYSSLPANERTNVPVNTGIEINFSSEVNPADIAGYFSIEPNVNGRFERFRNTVVFIPGKNLEHDTIYTVTVKEGLPSADGLILDEGLTFAFRTAEDRSSWASRHDFLRTGGGLSETFLPGDPAVIEVVASQRLLELPIGITLYQYKDAEAYRSALLDNAAGSSWQREYVFPTQGLTSVYSASDIPVRLEDGSRSRHPAFIFLPENLAEGYYLANLRVTIEGEELTAQKLIQINPLSVYASQLPNEVIFFINDTNSGNAASNASVTASIDGNSFSATAADNGTAHLKINADSSGLGVLSIEYNGHTYIDLLSHRRSTEHNPRNDYFVHIYTDRNIYRTTDEIYVWGVVLPRDGNALPLNDLYLRAGAWSRNNNDTDAIFVPVELKPDGTFSAVINIQNVTERWGYSIDLRTDDFVLTSASITLRDFVKPTYVFEVNAPDYAWMPHINPVKLSVNASFFEGTPAEGLRFEVDWNRNNQIVTNAAGYAETLQTARDENTWQPRSVFTSFRLTGIENEYASQSVSYIGFFRDVMLEHAYNNSRRTLDITTSMIDLSNWEQGRRWNNNVIRGEPVNVEVTATLTRVWHERIETGSYYDFINKRTVTTYSFERKRETVGTYTIDTVDGRGAFENLPINISGSTYSLTLVWEDTLGQTVIESIGGLRSDNSPDIWSSRRDDGLLSYSLSADSRSFTENQVISFELMENGERIHMPANARIFYAVSGLEFHASDVSNTRSFRHRMINDYIPNVTVSGAYFNGRHVFPITEGSYSFNSRERMLTITLEADKESYSPSETARVTMTVRDTNGNLVPNAAVSLSITDEAVFAVRDQTVSTLRNLYASISTPRINTYFSYVQRSIYDASGGFGGAAGAPANDMEASDSSESIRSDFRDTVTLLTGTTGSNGTAVFNVKLPDNLTTWRLTAQAVSNRSEGKVFAGNSREPLIVTIPFFLTVNSLPQYIAGDDISVSARVNGQITGNPQITGRITGNGVDKTVTALSNQTLNFGKLPTGRYTLLVSAGSGEFSDAVQLPLEVVETLLETYITRTFNLADGININPVRYPVSLTFYDNQYKLYGEVLSFLSRNWGNRADFRVASAFARKEFEHINEAEYKALLADISASGLIRLLPYGDVDIALTALICAAAPEIVNKNAVAGSFNNTLFSGQNPLTSEEVTWCYLGLAALSQPVLIDILTLLENPEGLSNEDKLRLCAALALLGDEDSALKYYRGLTINNDSERALALLTAGVLNLPEAEEMARRLMTSRSHEQTFVLELMTYLRYYNPRIAGNAVFSYNLNGRTETVTLNRFRGTTLRFGESQLANADFKVVSGDIGCKVFYIGRISDQETEPTLNVSKEYTLVDGSEWGAGALVRVTITVRGAERNRFYSIEDVIPSGARFTQDSRSNWVQRSEQRVNLFLFSYNNNSVSYYIRFANAGEFVTESAVVRDSNGNWGASERSRIIIT